MNITKEEIKKIALLSRLEVGDEEAEKYKKELSSILEYINKLQKVDTSQVNPDFYITDTVNSWRKDEMIPCSEVEREIILGNMPDKDGEELKTIGVFKK